MNVDNNDNGSIERPNMYFDPDLVKYLVYINHTVKKVGLSEEASRKFFF